MTSSKIKHFYLGKKYLKPTAEEYKFITAESIQCILWNMEGDKDTSRTDDSKEDATAELTTRKNQPTYNSRIPLKRYYIFNTLSKYCI